MKDLDFDELDRAVNSLMTNVPKADTSVASDHEKTLDITPTLSDDALPSFDRLEAATAEMTTASALARPTPIPTTPAIAQVPPAVRRGGRFMDVVHPSSDMKKPTVIPVRTAISRQGATIEPRNAPALQPVPDTLTTTTNAIPQSEEPAISRDEDVEQFAPVNEWPDPLEMADITASVEQKEPNVWEVPEPSEPVKEQLSETPVPVIDEEDEQIPLTSPFLPDTKVEKRPLGNNATSMPIQASDHLLTMGEDEDTPLAATVDSNDQLPVNSITQPQLPEELQGDVMAIEADTTHQGIPKTDEVQPIKDDPVFHDHQPKITMPPASAIPDEPLLTAGVTSISQQYREEPSTGESSNGAIYDTDSYHQPLAHPAQKKSGWMWVMWIVLILLVGAGGGAALYFLGII